VVNDLNELFNNQALELRRGTIVLAILSTLDKPLYGYLLLQRLEECGIAVDAGTLYPLLRRLEKQGLLESKWDTTDTRPRKYYQLSNAGTDMFERLVQEWSNISSKLDAMLKKANIK
jgi:PadR family transcriptional regulator, regulatory protein PadR